MGHKRPYILIALQLFVIGLSNCMAQQNPQFSQYLFNGVVINPAWAGSREYLNVNALYRKQWWGIDGSPTTQTLSIDGPFAIPNSAWGAHFTNDVLGPNRNTSLYAAYAQRIGITSSLRLALGAAIGVQQFATDGSAMVTYTPNDPSVPASTHSVWKPDLQIGIFLHSNTFFAGLSMSDIISGIGFENQLIPRPVPHIYLTTGAIASISDDLKLRPSIMLREDLRAPTNGDLTTFLIFRDRLWLGASYRTRIFRKERFQENFSLRARNAIALLVQIFPIEQLRIGYGYDITRTDLSRFGTHEFSLGYFFLPGTKAGMMTPRYF